MGTMSRKPPPRALALWLCWARAYLLACCKFGSLLIGLFEWRPGLVPLEGLPLNIAQNTLRPMFRMCGATSSCLGKALMLSIYNIHTLWKSLSETTALIDDRSISPHTTHIATDVNTNLYLYSNQRMILQHAYFARVYSTYIQLDFQLRAMDGRINMGNCTNNFV